MRNFDEKTLRSFLLGTLDETTQIAVEDAVFADAGLRAELESVENELIDEYTRNELLAAERLQFEKMFLNSAERVEKIEFAAVFNKLQPQKTLITTSAKIAEKESFWDKIRTFILMPQIAFAAVLLMFLILGGLFWLTRQTVEPQIALGNENRITNLEITPTPNANFSTPNPVNNNQSNALIANKSNTNRPIENKTVTPTPTPIVVKTPVETTPTFAAIIFPAGSLRDGNGKKFTLNLPKNSVQAHLVFNLEKGDEFLLYQIEIKSKSGELITKTKVPRRNHQILLTISTTKLSGGFYTATVRSLAADGTFETLGYYDFEVIKS